jgi:hypothetical protein
MKKTILLVSAIFFSSNAASLQEVVMRGAIPGGILIKGWDKLSPTEQLGVLGLKTGVIIAILKTISKQDSPVDIDPAALLVLPIAALEMLKVSILGLEDAKKSMLEHEEVRKRLKTNRDSSK